MRNHIREAVQRITIKRIQAITPSLTTFINYFMSYLIELRALDSYLDEIHMQIFLDFVSISSKARKILNNIV